MTRSRFGHIQNVGEGTYRCYWRKGGKTLTRTVHGTLDEAELFLARQRLEDFSQGTTWREFWIAKVAPQISGLAVKTREEYARLWRVELESRIGEEAVSAMDWERANAVLTSIAAPTVQRHAGALLKKMCNMAMRSKLLAWNPVDRAIEYAPHRKRRKSIVEAFEVGEYLAAMAETKYLPVLALELGAGLRVSEACALVGSDVSRLEMSGRLYAAVNVDKALVTTSSGALLKDTKNEPSARVAVCGEPFASLVLDAAKVGNAPLVASGRLYMASNPAWWYTSPETITHNWRAMCGRRGLRYVSQKDMRSSYATLMGEALAPDSIVSGNMGHSDGTTKGRNYQAVTVSAKCRAADCLTRLLAEFQ